MDVDEIIETALGSLIDNAITELYWKNSIISSTEFKRLLEELKNAPNKEVIKTVKLKLFREIIRNILLMSKCKSYNGKIYLWYTLAIFILNSIYEKNPIAFISSFDILFDQKLQVSFLNSVLSNHNFPSKFDKKCKLLKLARETSSMSDFVERKKRNASYCNNIQPTQQNSNSNSCPTSTFPTSIDKVIDAITRLLDTDENLNKTDAEIMADIDNELNGILPH
tara:strand:+ start:308 stop:976 length:669 start_codon:yes stop_codon:yes gene_type:complete